MDDGAIRALLHLLDVNSVDSYMASTEQSSKSLNTASQLGAEMKPLREISQPILEVRRSRFFLFSFGDRICICNAIFHC